MATDANAVKEIISDIYALDGDSKEELFKWFGSKTLVGGMIIDLQE